MTGSRPTAAPAREPSSGGSGVSLPSPEDCYRAVQARDARFDGWFWFGVITTGIYCRPSCPTPVHPRPEHTTFHATAAAAQRMGYRACKRCRPDASPGSPLWDRDQDLVGRAMRLIADGVVDREGVGGLASQLAVSTRHLDRVMNERVGAGPLAIARARRAQIARVLVETTDLRFAEVAFASGFSSVRQFNDTLRAVFDRTPSELRRSAGRPVQSGAPARPSSGAPASAVASPRVAAAAAVPLSLRLPHRTPLAVDELKGWFAAHPIVGVQTVAGGVLTRTLRLPHGNGAARLAFDDGHVRCDLQLDDVRDLATAVERCRRLLDLDADVAAIDADLCADAALAPIVRACPGLRTPGSVDGFETAIFALAGQQISVAAACATVGRLVERLGAATFEGLRVFPSPEAVADADLDGLGFTARTRDAVRTLAAVCAGGLSLDPGADRTEARARLLEIRGVGPWTADLVRLRALRDPDVLLAGDLVVRRRAASLGLPEAADALAAAGRRWSPWRSYATHHLWQLELDARLGVERRATR